METKENRTQKNSLKGELQLKKNQVCENKKKDDRTREFNEWKQKKTEHKKIP